MKDDNKKKEFDFLSSSSDSFIKQFKELLRKKAESLNQDNNKGVKKENIKIFEIKKISKYKIRTMTKLPPIKKPKKNINFLQYLQNTNNMKKIKKSPKNTLFPIKKGKMIYNNNSNKKLVTERLNINNNSLSTLYLKNCNNYKSVLEGNFDSNNNSLNNNNKDNSNNYDTIKYNKKHNIYFSNNSRKMIVKHINKNRSTEYFNLKKINLNNLKKKGNNIQRYDDNKNQYKKISIKLYNSEDTIFYNSNRLLKVKQHSNSYQHFLDSTNKSGYYSKNIRNENNSLNTLTLMNNNNINNKSKYYYNIYPGNNDKLIEKVILTRPNWEKLPYNKKKNECNLFWTPLSMQINYTFHKTIEEIHLVNHFEFHNELSNKRNIFLNLLKYCEINNINLFSFYPLTIIFPLNNDNFNIAVEDFKNCYFDLPNLIEDPEKKNANFLDKNYRNYFHVKQFLKLGYAQKLIIPKSHYGGKNLWLIKRINLNRGREIKILNDLDSIILEINLIKTEPKIKYILIQKYIEKPLLYCDRKFDIRIWVLFTYIIKTNKFNAYVFKEGHLKASSEIFDINSLDLFIHLTNYSVQKYNKNFSKIEIGNEISFDTFQKELDKKNDGKINFRKDILEKIVKIIGITANIAKNKINEFNRKNCFEIFGYDFILDENYNPFLLEINTNPGYEESSPLIKMLVPRMIDDALRLTIDKVFERNDKNKNISQFPVDNYTNEENMWQKIKI